MRKFILSAAVIFFASFAARAQVQFGSEIGAGIGIFNNWGDLNRDITLLNSQPAAQAIYRSNLSKAASLRATLTLGQLYGFDPSPPGDPLADQRQTSFRANLLEVAGGVEYHFLNWRDDIKRNRFSPYVHLGLGAFGFSHTSIPTASAIPAQYSKVQLAIPFGGGLKYVINTRYYIALEYGVRKTFFDYLDGVSDGDLTYKNYQYGEPHNNDTYSYIGLSISYTFYTIPCPHSPYRKSAQ